MDQLIKDFLQESRDNLDRLDQDFVSLESDPENSELMGSIFRTIHTVKGTCGFLGFPKLEALSHAGENLLSQLRSGELKLHSAISDALLQMVDAIREYLAEIEASENEGSREFKELIATLKSLQAPSASAPIVQPASVAAAPPSTPPANQAPAAAAAEAAPEKNKTKKPEISAGRLGGALARKGKVRQEEILRALQMQLAVLRKGIEVARKYLDFVQERFNRGITNELDVSLAQRQSAQLQSQIAPLAAQINAARYVIAVLLGEFPENLGSELTRPGMLPALPGRIRSGLPIELLRRRPDIAEAERQLASATAAIGVATADLFPRVALIASAGNQSAIGGVPVNPIWSVGPGVLAPILDFGRLDAAVEKADYRAREFLFTYKQTVLKAVGEVDTAVDAYAAQQNRLRHLSDALAAARKAVDLANERFDRGLIDSLNVIDAQRQEYEIEQQYVAAQAAAAEQLVALYKSLGGGWEDYQIFPPIRPPLPAIAAAFRSLLAPTARP